MMESEAMTMDETVEEMMRIHRSLLPRPRVEEVTAAQSLIRNVENEVRSKLEALEKQRMGRDVPQDLFSLFQEMQRRVIHFQSKEQKMEAQKLTDLEELHAVIDVLIQKASQFLQSHVSPATSSMESSPSSGLSYEKKGVKESVVSLSMDDLNLKKPKKSSQTTSREVETGGDKGVRLNVADLARRVEITAKKRSRELNLKGKLSDQIGYLPDSIGKLSYLIKLDLSENRIVILPKAIGGLFSLQSLDLHGNRIHELPDSIGSLRGLIHLNLSRNQLKSLPQSIGKLVHIVELDLSSNGVTMLPETIGYLSSLQILKAETNEIEEFPHTIGKCISIKELHADYNRIKALPVAVGRLVQLEILTLRYNKIKQLPTTMASLSSLKQLDLSFNEVEFIPESLCFATKLVKLDISNNFAELRELPRSIGNLEMLEELMCHNNQIRNLPDSFGLLARLCVLKLDGNPLVNPLKDAAKDGAQAVVGYMSDLVAKKNGKSKKESWVRIRFFSMPNNRHARN